jgi:hypothetical protein
VLLSDFGGFLCDVAASVVAGLIVLAVAYWFVEKKLSLRERAVRAQENEDQRRQTREAVLKAVHGELESNAAQLTTALEELPKEDERLLYPLFDVSVWPIVSSTGVFTSLQPETATALVSTYNRMTTANEQNELLLDFSQGRSGILVTMAAAPSLDNELVTELYERFRSYRAYIRRSLLERLQELKQHLDAAIDAVEAELGLDVKQKASQRVFRPERRPTFAGGGRPKVAISEEGRAAVERHALPPPGPSRTYEASELGTRRSLGHVLNDQVYG